MSQHRRFRGVSLGTIVMLMVTCMVAAGFSLVLPRLGSSTDVVIDTSKVLEALSLGDGLPQLSLSDIPIAVKHSNPPVNPVAVTLSPAVATAKAVQTPVPPSPTSLPLPTDVPGGSFTMAIGGSVTVDTNLRQANYYSEAKKYDFSEMLTQVREDFQADFTMVALNNVIYPEKKLTDVNTTPDVLSMLTAANVQAVALGYHHACNHGLAGVTSTLTAVQESGLKPIGVYFSPEDAAVENRIMTINGVKVALLHYTDTLSDTGKKAMKKDGCTFAVPLDAVSDGADAILTDIAELRQAGAQVVVVSVSWNAASDKTTPTKKQIAFAQQLADAGADVILGMGTRAIQPAVWLTGHLSDGSSKQVLCLYSLGSLVNSSRTNANVTGMILHLKLTFDGTALHFDEVSYTPTYIWRYKQDGRYYYRVVASHRPAPVGMETSQQESMARALKNAQKYLGETSPLALR